MIPVSDPIFVGNEKKYLNDAIDRGQVSGGYYVQRFEEEFAKWCHRKYAVAVNSGTSALETAIWASKIKGEIIMPSSTIISCATAARRANCTPVFCDLHLDSPSMDVESVANCQSMATKAILRVHLFGKFSDIPIDISYRYKDIHDCSQFWDNTVHIDEDAILVYSLYANKMITSGEGGIIATNSKMVYDFARSYRNLCHGPERFVHTAEGYNFRMSEMQGAVALAQLENIDWFISLKNRVKMWYKKYLPDKTILLADVPVPWMFLISTPLPAKFVCDELYEAGVDTRRFFCPLHKQSMPLGMAPVDLSRSEYAWNHWLYLPSGLMLTETQVEEICKYLRAVLNSTR
ncbi:MAG TPA: DegT/DnrJ/EryC1/StrS family aminotransferase [Candidatus Omnitrophota bacterium]|nr:DegT/DnrJ/EryC1/StrS family aminotransferase [Candidatus Omnitrophota bacterium]